MVYFAPNVPDFSEAGELKSDDLAASRRIFDEQGLSGGNVERFPATRAPESLWRVRSGDEDLGCLWRNSGRYGAIAGRFSLFQSESAGSANFWFP